GVTTRGRDHERQEDNAGVCATAPEWRLALSYRSRLTTIAARIVELSRGAVLCELCERGVLVQFGVGLGQWERARFFGLRYNKAERLARGHKSQRWFLATTEKKGVHPCRNREERKAVH
ncbi:hypothetical protein INR49_005211, partial [Caranx melampygus]